MFNKKVLMLLSVFAISGVVGAAEFSPKVQGLWSTSGPDRTFTNGLVGIGGNTVNPFPLAITADSSGSALIIQNATNSGVLQILTDNVTYASYIGVEDSSGNGVVNSGDPHAFILANGNNYPMEFWTNDIKRLMINADGTMVASQSFAANGGVLISTTSSQPTCDSTHRGMIWNLEGGSGVADALQVCQKDSSNAYAWKTFTVF